MSTNLVLLVKDRPRLTEQCLKSLYANTPMDQFNVVCVDDGSGMETRTILADYWTRKNCHIIHFAESIGIVGFLRNVGAWASERYFGCGEYLAFLDNDIAVFPGWLDKIKESLGPLLSSIEAGKPVVDILGGCRHPYHGVNGTTRNRSDGSRIELTDAVAGYSLFMRWGTWADYGPFDSNQKGVGASEDFALCQRVIADGGKVGYIHPPVLAHCGIVNTDNKPATGADQFQRVPGILYL